VVLEATLYAKHATPDLQCNCRLSFSSALLKVVSLNISVVMAGRGGGYPGQAPSPPLAIPGMNNRQDIDSQRRATAPAPGGIGLPGMQSRTANAAADGLALPGMQSRASLPAPGQAGGGGPLIPGLSGRGDPPPSKPGGVLIPGLGGGPSAPVTQDTIKGPYVTDTITTPLNRSRRRGGPVKLTSMEPDGGVRIPMTSSASMEVDRRLSASSATPSLVKKTSSASIMKTNSILSSGMLPKWASSGGKGGMQIDSQLTTHTSGHISGGMISGHISHQGSQLSEFDNSSFLSWAPQAFVQSWHQKLNQKYQDYNMVNMVGEGRHGAVFIVQHKQSEQYYACKLLNKSNNEVQSMRQEIEAMRRLDHPNIVRLFETLEDTENVFLLMELCQGGDLFSLITSQKEGRLSESVSRTFAEQMLSALAYCHGNGFVHRDVKPENFLLYEEDPECQTLKLADFGIATSIRPVNMMFGTRSTSLEFDTLGSQTSFDAAVQHTGSMASSASRMMQPQGGDAFRSYSDSEFCGSLPYMAPELLSKQWKVFTTDKNKQAMQAALVDCWSTGIVIYVMLSGDLPFGSDPDLICSGQPPPYESEVWRSVSRHAKDLILKFVSHKVEERLSARQGVRHEWITSGAPESGERVRCGSGLPEQRRDIANGLLTSLRRWSTYPKLRRIAIGAIAKRLEGDHVAQRMAEQVYRKFGDASQTLRCDRLVEAMNAALAEGDPSLLQTASSPYSGGVGGMASTRSARSSDTSSISASSPSERSTQSRTGLHIRQRVGASNLIEKMKMVAGVSANGRADNKSEADASTTASTVDQSSADVVSLTELRVLVNMLDSTKSGAVIYTLLVAAFLPPDVYCDDRKIKEVFEMFDVRNRGRIGAQDLAEALGKHKDADMKKLASSLAVFDLNNDGALDFREFRLMVRGETGAERPNQSTSGTRRHL